MENREIAAVLEEIAAITRVTQDDPKWSFKASAYDRAKRSIESYPERLEDLARDPERKLTEVPGVGADIAAKIKELLDTGRLQYHQEQLKKIPRSLLDIMQVQGIGPQKARLFYQQLDIKTLDDLQAAAKHGRLRELPGMSEKSEQNILKALSVFQRAAGRFRLDTAYDTAEEIRAFLAEAIPKFAAEPQSGQSNKPGKAHEDDPRLVPAGSLRRGRETVADLDLLVTGGDRAKIAERFLNFPRIAQVLVQGDDKISVKLSNHMQVDLRLLRPAEFGAALMYFTGSKEHNVALRDRAKRRGWKLSEYGLFEGDKVIASRTEEEIYKKLGLEYVPPEIREAMGEIELAEAGKLPDLVELKDIRGDLQMHTTASDGRNSVEEMAEAAKQLGYQYILITDHSKAVTIANGLDDRRAVENIARIKAARQHVKGIEIWAGAEVDILGGGALDYPDEILRQFDIVLASVHSRMTQPGEEMTERLIKALANPYVRILGHPTGRYILRRDPFNFDVERVFDAAKKHGVALEVNASTERLDLCDRHVRLARDKGIKLVISTDAHQPKHFDYMRYGVATARRGWAEKSEVINTYPPAKLLQSLRPHPA